MSDHHHHEETKRSPALNLIAGVVLIAIGSTVGHNWQPELPGLEVNFGVTLAMIGVLLIMFPVIKSFYTQPLFDAINERNSHLERTFTEAEQLREQMNTMRSEYEQRLASTEAQAREQIQAQIREAQNLRTQLMGEAQAKADELVRKAQEEIESEKNRVLTEIRLQVVDLTLAATEKILGENIDDARNRKLVEEFIDKVEVPG